MRTVGQNAFGNDLLAHCYWMCRPTRVNLDPSEMYCEGCGSAVRVQSGSVEYCLECGLYVCAHCWSSPGSRCRACVEASRHPARNVSLRLARRADRRLREVAREGAVIAAVGGSAERGDAWTDHACLTVKADAAERAGMRALRELRGRSAARARPLAERIQRHTQIADAVLDGAASGLIGLDARASLNDSSEVNSTAADVSGSELIRAWRPVGALLLVAAGILALVVLTPGWLDLVPLGGTPDGEGVLGGDPGGEGAAVASDFDDSVFGKTASPSASSPSASPATLAMGFDTVRMGGGIGEKWIGSAGIGDAVSIAAFPTPIDRSASLAVTYEARPEACHALDPPIDDVNHVAIDAILDGEDPAEGTVELRDAADETVMVLGLAASSATLLIGSGPVVEAPGLEPGHWYSMEVLADGAWRVLLRDDPDGAVTEAPVGAPTLGSVAEVCLRADGPPGAAVNYDNLLITNEAEGEESD